MKARAPRGKQVPIENYRRLVAQQAWRAWRCLPISVRSWIGIDDMIEHGMWSVHWFLNKQKQYLIDPKRSMQYTTSLTHVLHNMYIRNYIEKYGSQQSGWQKVNGKLVPIYVDSLERMRDSMEGKATMDDVVGFIPSLTVDEESIFDQAFTECFVIPALSRVHEQASPQLKSEMVNWFWGNTKKVHVNGKPFKRLTYEFRELCFKEHVMCDDCLHLTRSPKCLDSLSRELLWIPFDLENPTPDMKPSKFVMTI